MVRGILSRLDVLVTETIKRKEENISKNKEHVENLRNELKDNSLLKSMDARVHSSKVVIVFLLVSFFLWMNVFMAYNNAIQEEYAHSALVAKRMELRITNIPVEKKEDILRKYKTDLSNHIFYDRVALSLLFSVTLFTTIGCAVLIDKKMYTVEEKKILNKYFHLL